MKNFKIIALFLLVIFILLELFVFENKLDSKTNKPTVSVSSFSLYDITKHISNNSVNLVSMLPFGVDPHSFELTPKIMADIEKSQLIIYSGAGLEPWIKNINFKNKVIDMSEHVKLRKLGADEFEFHQHHDAQCAHNTLDPHYWLDFKNMQKATIIITEALITLEPKYEKMYIKNRDKYIHMLQMLDENYTKYLHTCKLNRIIINHNSIGYLAATYHFKAVSLSGLSPESDPSPNDIKRVLHQIQNYGISTVFYESFENSKLMQTISKDSNVNIQSFESLGNITADEAKIHATYEELMYRNLKKLQKALLCN